MFDRVWQGGSIFCFAFELFASFDASDRSYNIDDGQVLLVEDTVYTFEFAGQWRKVNAYLRYDIWVFVKSYLELFLFRNVFDLASTQQVVVADYQILASHLRVSHKIYTFHLGTHLVRNYKVSCKESVLALNDR